MTTKKLRQNILRIITNWEKKSHKKFLPKRYPLALNMFLKRKRNEIQHILDVGLTVRYFIEAILQFYDLLLLALSGLATQKDKKKYTNVKQRLT